MVFKVKMPNIPQFQLVIYEDLLLFLLLCDGKFNILHFVTVGWTKQAIWEQNLGF